MGNKTTAELLEEMADAIRTPPEQGAPIEHTSIDIVALCEGGISVSVIFEDRTIGDGDDVADLLFRAAATCLAGIKQYNEERDNEILSLALPEN